MSDYKPVIGLEIHVELATQSKMFCQCPADFFGKKPNTQTCPVCLGLPGALPVPNKLAVEWTIKIGKALNCQINLESKFDRKHYFYPDLPKGYQISQYDEPIAQKGSLTANGKKFGITRVHLEEDTGKLTHSGTESLVDFNRSGVPLVEIVTEPDFETSEDVVAFLKELHTIIKEYLKVSDANMEQGSMRLEPNISVRKPGEKGLPQYKVEVKNINSFNYVKKAVEFEIMRQTKELKEGKTPAQETRGYNETKGITVSQRVKEEAQDYRYFPEPDIPPLSFTQKFIDSVRLPELPQERMARYVDMFELRDSDAFLLTRSEKAAFLFEELLEKLGKDLQKEAQKVANLIINKKIDIDHPAEKSLKTVKEKLSPTETDAGQLTETIDKVILNNPKEVEAYKAGKENLLMFFVGQVMKEMKGKADGSTVKQELTKALGK